MIAACAQPARADAADADTLRGELAKTLPGYMVPQRIIFLPELPLTAGGKVDRRELANIFAAPPPSPAGADPRSPLERRLVRMWKEILKRKRIGIYDNFFELGGDSLQAMEFLTRLSKELGKPCSADLLLARPTVAQIAEAAEIGIIEGPGDPSSSSLQATLLAMRKGGSGGAPLVFIPGGYITENELAVCASLLPRLNEEWAVWGVRFNLVAKNLRRPRTLAEIAAHITEKLLRNPEFHSVPVLVGECQACVLALETGRQFAEKTGKSPTLILLDPWQPRQNPPRRASHPAAVFRYYRLLRAYQPGPAQCRIHLVCCEDSPRRAETCLDWWRSRTQAECRLHIVPGDHRSYIRLHKESLARTLNAICESEPAEKWSRGFFKLPRLI